MINRELQERLILLTLSGLAIVFTWLAKDNPFFWDTVQLASKQAHFFYESGFSNLILPVEIDSGHPPSFGFYIASCWKVFGKTLPVSHFAMLPFLIGNLWLLFFIGKHYLGAYGTWFPFLCFVDPTLSAQSILVSPDIVLIFFFLLSWFAIIKDQEKLLAFAIMGLGLISMRGWMVAVALFIFSLFQSRTARTSMGHFIQKVTPFLPGAAIGLSFLIYHKAMTGWIGYHPESPWAGSFATVSVWGFCKNIGILIWRYMDFGRLFIYGTTYYFLFIWDKEDKPNVWEVLTLTSILELALVPSLLIHEGLLGHRYLLPIFIGMNLLFCLCIKELSFLKNKPAWWALGVFFLLSGNLWIYPKHVSQGWDASLAHVPFYELRADLLDYLDKENIPSEDVGTVFPQKGSFELYDLNGKSTGFAKADFEKSKYIYYSTVMNDFSDEQLEILETDWQPKMQFESYGIEVILYERKNSL